MRTQTHCPLLVTALLCLLSTIVRAATHQVIVQEAIPHFDPLTITIEAGDTVQWTWADNFRHSVTSGRGESDKPDGIFNSGSRSPGSSFSFTFQNVGNFRYYCDVHNHLNTSGNWPEVTVVEPRAKAAQPLNVSTRLRVQSGENAMIGGFIVTGDAAKRVIVRAIGPSLNDAGVAGALTDPTIELNGANGAIASNDDWRATQEAEIQASGVPPSDERESAIVATLSPGNYTAVVRGKDQASGIGLVEVYDLEMNADSQLANISTRGFVHTGNDVMIGGFILGNASPAAKVIIRALGPSLAGISNTLPDPTLNLVNGNGESLAFNNNWRDTQEAEIQASTIPPPHNLEAAIVVELSPGSYTAVVAGNTGSTGVGLVELYQLD